VTILGAVLDKVGIGRGFSVNLDDAFRKAGLENVSIKKVKYPIGAKTANPEASRSSIETFLTTVETAVDSVKGQSGILTDAQPGPVFKLILFSSEC
jgi:hypothetical protein